MLLLKPRQRAIMVEKLPDFANIGAGVLVFGEFVGEGRLSIFSALAGAGLWLVLFGWAVLLAGDES
jgi:hypothetical protein